MTDSSRGHGRPRFFYGWAIVAMTALLVFVTSSTRSGLGIFVVPMSDKFGWDRATISFAAGMGTVLMGVVGPFVGLLVDRFGGRSVVTAALALIALSTVLLAWTTGFLFFFLVYGVVGSMAMSGVNLAPLGVIVARWFRGRRGTAMGLMAVGMPLGQLFALPSILFLVNSVGWRTTWGILGAVIGVMVPLSFLILRDSPQAMGLQPDSSDPTLSPARRAPLETEQWPHSFRSPPIWQIMSGMFLCGFTDISMGVHMVPFAQEAGLSTAVIALALAILGITNIAGSFLTGIASDHFGRKNPLLFAYVARAIAYAFLIFAHGNLALLGFAALAGFTWIATGPLTFSLTSDIYGLRHLGVLSGMVQMSHQIGAGLGIYLYGLMRDVTGDYHLAFIVGGAALVSAALITMGLSEHRYSTRYQASIN